MVSQRARVAVCLLVVVCHFVAVFAKTRYVGMTGSDSTNDCTNVGSPCASINHALAQVASSPDSKDAIMVEPGTYPPVSYVALGGNDVSIVGMQGADQTFIDCEGGFPLETGVNFGSPPYSEEFSVQGITVRHCRWGIGLYGPGVVSDVVITASRRNINDGDHRGLIVEGSGPVGLLITDVDISDVLGGVAMRINPDISASDSVTIEHCQIQGTTTSQGAPVWIRARDARAGTITFRNNVVRGNSAIGSAESGGVHVEFEPTTAVAIVIEHNLILGNTAHVGAGGLSVQVGATGESLNLACNVVQRNYVATDITSAGVKFQGSDITIDFDRNAIASNYAINAWNLLSDNGAVGVDCGECALPNRCSSGTCVAPCASGTGFSCSASKTCVACPAGEFSNPTITGHDLCLSCDPGYYTPGTSTSNTECLACPIGTYTSMTGTSGSCSLCPTGYTTVGYGAISSGECVIRTCGDGTVSEDEECDPQVPSSTSDEQICLASCKLDSIQPLSRFLQADVLVSTLAAVVGLGIGSLCTVVVIRQRASPMVPSDTMNPEGAAASDTVAFAGNLWNTESGTHECYGETLTRRGRRASDGAGLRVSIGDDTLNAAARARGQSKEKRDSSNATMTASRSKPFLLIVSTGTELAALPGALSLARGHPLNDLQPGPRAVDLTDWIGMPKFHVLYIGDAADHPFKDHLDTYIKELSEPIDERFAAAIVVGVCAGNIRFKKKLPIGTYCLGQHFRRAYKNEDNIIVRSRSINNLQCQLMDDLGRYLQRDPGWKNVTFVCANRKYKDADAAAPLFKDDYALDMESYHIVQRLREVQSPPMNCAVAKVIVDYADGMKTKQEQQRHMTSMVASLISGLQQLYT